MSPLFAIKSVIIRIIKTGKSKIMAISEDEKSQIGLIKLRYIILMFSVIAKIDKLF